MDRENNLPHQFMVKMIVSCGSTWQNSLLKFKIEGAIVGNYKKNSNHGDFMKTWAHFHI